MSNDNKDNKDTVSGHELRYSAGDTFSNDSYSRNDIPITSKENKSKVIVMNKKSYFYKNEYLLSIIFK